MKNLTRRQRKMLFRILAAAALLIAVKLLPDQIYPADRWVIDFTGGIGLHAVQLGPPPVFALSDPLWDHWLGHPVEGRPQHPKRPDLRRELPHGPGHRGRLRHRRVRRGRLRHALLPGG